MFPWNACFEEIDLCIESKDYEGAKTLIQNAMVEAERALIDPRFLMTQLRGEKIKVERLEAELRSYCS